MAQWQRRITGHADVPPDTLLAHPDNVKVHGPEQMDAMQSLLDQIGWAADILVSQRSGRVIDGHMRVLLALKKGEPTVPVTYVDLTPDEEYEALVYLYRTTQMARIDPVNLEAVLTSVSSDDPLITAMLHGFAAENGVVLEGMTRATLPPPPGDHEPVHITIGDIEFTIPFVEFQAWSGALTTELGTQVWVIGYELKKRLGL